MLAFNGERSASGQTEAPGVTTNTKREVEAMRIEFVRWGIELESMGLLIRLVPGDVFLRVPLVRQLAWNQCGLFVDHWEDAKRDPVLRY